MRRRKLRAAAVSRQHIADPAKRGKLLGARKFGDYIWELPLSSVVDYHRRQWHLKSVVVRHRKRPLGAPRLP
jgi:hypothetical protein